MPPSSTEQHLRIQLTELQRRHDILTRRISALDTDIGRELDSERKLSLQDRRSDLAAEREQVSADIAQIDRQLSGPGSIAAPPTAALDSSSSPASATPSLASQQPEQNAPGSGEHKPTPSPGDVQPQKPDRGIWLWFLAGIVPIVILGVLFFETVACILEYRLTEQVANLLGILVGGATLLFALLAVQLRSRISALLGGVSLALIALIIIFLLLPSPAQESCAAGRPVGVQPDPTATVQIERSKPATTEPTTALSAAVSPDSATSAPAREPAAETAPAAGEAPPPAPTNTPTPTPPALAETTSPGQWVVSSAEFFDETDARTFAWSPDGSAVAIGGSFLYLYDVTSKTGRRVSTDTMGQIAYTPDGSTLVAAPYDGLTPWDTATWIKLDRLPGSKGSGTMAIAPDGVTLAAAIGDTVGFWNLVSGESRVFPSGQRITALAFSPDSSALAVGGDKLTLWKVSDGSVQNTIAGQKDIQGLAFSPDGLVLAAASSDGVRLWKLVAPERPQGYLASPSDGGSSVAYSPDGTLIATGGSDLIVRLWNAATGDQLASVAGHSERISQVAFSPDGTKLASGAGDGLRLWQVARGSEATATAPVRGAPPAPLAPVPLAADAIAPGNAPQVAAVGLFDESDARQFDWSPDGGDVAIGGSFLYLYDVIAKTGYRASTDTMGQVRFTPDGATLLGSPYNAITLWDVASVTRLNPLPDSKNVQAFAVSPDGATVVAAIGEALRFWDLPSRAVLVTVPAGERIYTLAFSPDGRVLAAGGDKLTLRDPATGLVQTTIEGQTNVRDLAFSPDNLELAAVSSDGGVRLWNLATGRPRGLAVDPTIRISSIAFSPNGLVIAGGGSDQLVRLWDVDTGGELTALAGHTNEVNKVAFAPDGATLASGGADGLRLWRVAP